MKAVNSPDHEAVRPILRTDYRWDNGILNVVLKPASFVTIVMGNQKGV